MTNWIFQLDFGQGFQVVDPPRNWQGIIVSILFTDDQPNGSLQGLNLEWTGETATLLNNYRNAGVTGGVGIYEGVGIRIYPCANQLLFDGYIDLADASTTWECDRVIAPCVEKARTDSVNDLARGVSFAVLATLPVGSQGRIIPSVDYKKIPYCVTAIPDGTQIALLSISNIVILRELQDLIKTIPQQIQSLIGAATTTAATLGASVALIVAEIIKTVLYILYLAAIIVAIVNMVKALIDNIWQSKKYKLGMREEDCWKRMCQYFGLGFSSTIYSNTSAFKNATHIPAKNVIPSTANPLNVFQRPYDESVGFPNNPDVYGHPDENCGDFIARMCQKYNAGVSIINNVLYFEEVHYWNNSAAWQIPNTDEQGNTFNLPDPNKTNAAELYANYYIAFSTDQGDLNTIHRYKGTSCEVQVRPINTVNAQRRSQQNGIQIIFPEALAKRKQYLTRVEKALNQVINALSVFANTITSLVNGLINALNWAIGLFGGNTTAVPTIPPLPTNILNNRLGWMEMTNDSFSVPKTFIGVASGSDWHLHSNTEGIMSAANLMSNYHGKNLGTRGNQQLVYTDRQFKFCCDDFIMLQNRNVVLSPRGIPAKFRGELKWDIHNDIIRNAEWSEFTNFTNNLQETIIVDGK
jgi:hypothetical protein